MNKDRAASRGPLAEARLEDEVVNIEPKLVNCAPKAWRKAYSTGLEGLAAFVLAVVVLESCVTLLLAADRADETEATVTVTPFVLVSETDNGDEMRLTAFKRRVSKPLSAVLSPLTDFTKPGM